MTKKYTTPTNPTKYQLAIIKLIKKAGSQTALANYLKKYFPNVCQGHVWKWLNVLGFIPAKYTLHIQKEYGIKPTLICSELLPK